MMDGYISEVSNELTAVKKSVMITENYLLSVNIKL